jgi:hypothetical protein
MQILSAHGKQGQLPHELLVLTAAVLAVDKVDPLDIGRVPDDSAWSNLSVQDGGHI